MTALGQAASSTQDEDGKGRFAAEALPHIGQLRAAATGGQRRLESHPCPDPELGRRLGGLLERFVFIARSLESTTEEYGDGYIPALAHQLRTLLADFTVFIADLGHAIEGH